MATLRELTQASHDAIEELPLNKSIFDGSVSELHWALLLHQKRHLYAVLERKIPNMPENLKRVQLLNQDCDIMTPQFDNTILPATQVYLEHLTNLKPNLVWGHLYVHYMGELFGGQMLKRKIDFGKLHMDFENRKELVDWMRSNLAGHEEELAEEANLGFRLTMDVYNEIFNYARSS